MSQVKPKVVPHPVPAVVEVKKVVEPEPCVTVDRGKVDPGTGVATV